MNKEIILDLLKTHNIPINTWGKGSSKTLDHLVKEISEEESTLKINQDGLLQRTVSVVFLNVFCCIDSTTMILKETKQVFTDGRERRRNIPTSLGEKMRSNEEPIICAIRALKEELNISSNFSIGPVTQKTKGPEESHSYPGLYSVYHTYEIDVLIDKKLYKPNGYVEVTKNQSTYFKWFIKPAI